MIIFGSEFARREADKSQLMKQLLIACCAMLCGFSGLAQFDKIVVEEIDNKGLVPGKTWRVYALMTNPNDHVHAVYAKAGHPLSLRTTTSFYQHEYGAATTSGINAKLIKEKPELAYDSWVTLGMEDNSMDTVYHEVEIVPDSVVHYENTLNVMTLDVSSFEKGGNMEIIDGAWFCIPTMPQIRAGKNKKVLLMQLTSDGKIEGSISMQGQDKDGVTWSAEDVKFTCEP